MQSALLVIGRFPPPTSGANIFARLHCPRAWLASDTRKSLLVQLVIRDVMAVYIFPYLLFVPADQRIDFHQSVCLVPFDRPHSAACNRLFTPKAAYPSVQSLKGPFERFELAHPAAAFALFQTLIESVHTAVGNQFFDCGTVRKEKLQTNTVVHGRPIERSFAGSRSLSFTSSHNPTSLR